MFYFFCKLLYKKIYIFYKSLILKLVASNINYIIFFSLKVSCLSYNNIISNISLIIFFSLKASYLGYSSINLCFYFFCLFYLASFIFYKKKY